MLPVAEVRAVVAAQPAIPAVPASLPFAHREAYGDYFARLARHDDSAAALRRLITHLDAALDGAERVRLWLALWQCAQRLGREQRDAVAASLDGRHAPALALLDQAWDAPELIERLASRSGPGSEAADFVPALLAHHGLDPLADPASHRPRLLLLAAQAEAHAGTSRLAADRIAALQRSALSATERDPALLPQGLALLFELALHAADEATATAVLAELLRHGQGHVLRADRVRGWLDGTALDDDEERARPLLLAAAWQRLWLQPATWGQPQVLAALHAALVRPGPRHRLQDLAAALADAAPPHAARAATDPGEALQALKALQALDSAYALIDGGGDAEPVLRPLLEPGTLAPAAMASVHRGSARWHALQGDIEGQVLALLRARRHGPSPALRAALSALLPAPVPAFSADWRDEQPYWQQLLQHEQPAWRRLAAFALATLWTAGLLEPRPPRHCQQLDDAHALWTQLATDARYAPLADAALRAPALTRLRPALRREGSVEHLWFETPGATGVTVVFSCIATHHTYAEVGTLRGRLPGQHLMFVRCPDKNWYSDDAFDAVRELLRSRLLSRFDATDVTCWYGSMGGHGALKFALEFGLRAIVFNPQTDLDLWAAFRPRERALLWGAERHARLSDWPLAAWQRAPLYYACGAATADREALSFVIERLRRCSHLTAVIEKFDDPNHAGLMNRIAGGAVAPALARIQQRLRQLEGDAPLAGAQPLHGNAQAAFWDRLDAARALKVELQVRGGRLWWQPSQACGTRLG